jgi:hypothetical protein
MMRNRPALGVGVSFVWKVANSGYQWRDIPEAGRLLCAVDAFRMDWNDMFGRYQRSDQPLQDATGLFLEFADLEPNETAIVQFANRYGLLKNGDNIPTSTNFGPVLFHGETLESWKLEIGALRSAVDLWRAMLKGRDELASALSEREDTSELPLMVRHKQHLDDLDLAMAALSVVRQGVSTNLRNELDVDLLFPGNEPRLQLSLRPFSLLGAIWLQFAAAVEARRNFEKCRNCGRPFEISRAPATGKRSDAKFCSTRCRVGSYHVRIEQARRLAELGVPPVKIAQEVGSDVATVRRWIRSVQKPTRQQTAKGSRTRRASRTPPLARNKPSSE